MAPKRKQIAASLSAAAASTTVGGSLLRKPPFLVSGMAFSIENTKGFCPLNFFLKFQKLLLKSIDRCGSYWSVCECGSCIDKQNADLVILAFLCQCDPRVCELNVSRRAPRLETSERGSHL